MIFAPWCATEKCEENFKRKDRRKIVKFAVPAAGFEKEQKCFACKEKAQSWFYLGKAIEYLGLFVKKKD